MINNSANAVKDSIKAVLTAGCIAMLTIAVVYFKANALQMQTIQVSRTTVGTREARPVETV